jgi:putative RNA 2'-phosphotransferase
MSSTSRLLSRILRHAPEDAGLTLQPGGWVLLDDLVSGLQAASHDLSREAILRVVAESDKKRFTLSEDGQRIRAAQGHSVEVDLGLAPCPPPDVLFHGTATKSLDRIRTEGLRPGNRRHVHLSPDEETAKKVGQRHGRPVVLKVDTAVMHREGHLFWMADNGVWLTDHVPPRYLSAASGG